MNHDVPFPWSPPNHADRQMSPYRAKSCHPSCVCHAQEYTREPVVPLVSGSASRFDRSWPHKTKQGAVVSDVVKGGWISTQDSKMRRDKTEQCIET